MDRGDNRLVWKGVVAGAIGGIIAACVMEQFQAAVSAASSAVRNGSQSSDEERAPESSHSDPATVKAADAMSQAMTGRAIPSPARGVAGELVHYGFGSTVGAVYGGLAESRPATARGAGVPFGTAVWLLADEVGVPLAGLSNSPTDTPISTHLYALASHAVYGITLEIARRGVRALI